MAWTYDISTDRGKVRLLIGDVFVTDANAVVFTDDDIDAFLLIEGSVLKYAAAQALDSMASQEAMIQKVLHWADVQTNGAATARFLHERAAILRSQVDDSFEVGTFDWAEIVYDEPGVIEHLYNEAQRQA